MLPHETGYFYGKVYGVAVAFEVVAIIAVSIWLRRTEASSLLSPAIAIIVGQNFLGLWLSVGAALFLGLTVALCTVGIVGVRSPAGHRLPVAGLASALALWVAGAVTSI